LHHTWGEKRGYEEGREPREKKGLEQVTREALGVKAYGFITLSKKKKGCLGGREDPEKKHLGQESTQKKWNQLMRREIKRHKPEQKIKNKVK